MILKSLIVISKIIANMLHGIKLGIMLGPVSIDENLKKFLRPIYF